MEGRASSIIFCQLHLCLHSGRTPFFGKGVSELTLSKRLREWALQRGWTVEKGKAYGDYAGYTFTAFEGAGFKAFATWMHAGCIWTRRPRRPVAPALSYMNK